MLPWSEALPQYPASLRDGDEVAVVPIRDGDMDIFEMHAPARAH